MHSRLRRALQRPRSGKPWPRPFKKLLAPRPRPSSEAGPFFVARRVPAGTHAEAGRNWLDLLKRNPTHRSEAARHSSAQKGEAAYLAGDRPAAGYMTARVRTRYPSDDEPPTLVYLGSPPWSKARVRRPEQLAHCCESLTFRDDRWLMRDDWPAEAPRKQSQVRRRPARAGRDEDGGPL